MAKCVFCGEKAARGKTIVIGDMSLSCCEICHEHFSGMDREDIARAVLNAGIYGYPWLLEDYLERQAAKRREEYEKQLQGVEEYKKWREGREAGICPKCGGAMIKNDPVDFLSTGGTALTLQWSTFNTDICRYVPVSCEDCGYTEFYSFRKRPADPVPPEGPGEEENDY